MASQTAVASADALIEALAKSELLDECALAKVRESAASTSDPKALARELVKNGTLTKWQALQLLLGYYSLWVGKYKLLDQIGSGEMGRVYLAEHGQMGRRHALKILARRHTSRPEVLKRFLAEAQRVCALEHRNLCHIFDVNQEGDKYFLVMEHVEGQDLQRLVEKSGRLPAVKAVQYVQQAAAGLRHAHEQQVFHGTLKPSNLLVDAAGTVKIADIGLGRLAAGPAPSGVGETGEAEGLATAVYHAPEQRDGRQAVAGASDVYSLGNVLCYLLAGQPAVDADDAEKLLEKFKDIPQELSGLVVRMMATSPTGRPQSMADVLAALAAIPLTVAAAPPPPLPKAKKPPVAKPLDGDDADAVMVDAVPDDAPAASATPAAENPLAGLAIKPQFRPRSGGLPAKAASAPAVAPAVKASAGPATAPRGKNSNWLLILAGIAAVGLLLLGGAVVVVAVVIYWAYHQVDKTAHSLTNAARQVAAADEAQPVRDSTLPKSPSAEASGEANPRTAPMPDKVEPAATPVETPPPAAAAAAPAPLPVPLPAPVPVPLPEPGKPAPEPAKPAPANPEPAKPQPAQPKPGNPFQGLAKSVSLPKLDPAKSEPPPEALAMLVLGPCLVDEKAPATIQLRGGDGAIRTGKQKFDLREGGGGTSLTDWEVLLTSGQNSLVIALLSVKNHELTFQWTPEGAKNASSPYLCNCALDLASAAAQHQLALRQPIKGESLLADLEKQGAVKWNGDYLPDPKKVTVEITKLSGFGKHQFETAQQLDSQTPSTIVWTGKDDKNMILGLKLDWSITARQMQVKSSPQFKLEGMPKARPLLKRDLQAMERDIDQTRFVLNAQEQAAKAQGTDAQKRGVKADQDRNNLAGEQLNQLKEAMDGLQGKGEIHFRVYFQADGAQIDLVVTDGAAAPAKGPERKPAEPKSDTKKKK